MSDHTFAGRNRLAPVQRWWLAPLMVYAGAGLATAAIAEQRRTRLAESAHPPAGRFLDTPEARLHYVDVGHGRPVVLLHGIGATLDDWFISGVVDLLAPFYRIIAVDRPGSGYSSRPGSAWPPERQAAAIAELLRRLGADDAVIVGHSFGCLPALALALRFPRAVHALVLVAGPFATRSPIIEQVARVPHLPLLSGIARATATPAAARAAAPRLWGKFFEPQPVTRRFVQEYPLDLACRPSQLRASAEDAAATDPAIARLVPAAPRIGVPIAVVCGSGDALFDPDLHARPFAAATGTALAVIPAGGHMVHHSFPGPVAAVIRDAADGRLPVRTSAPTPAGVAPGPAHDAVAAPETTTPAELRAERVEDDAAAPASEPPSRVRAASAGTSPSARSGKGKPKRPPR